MRVVHLADCHLGFRGYQKLTSGGINQRESDVARTFTRTISQVIAIAPDLVVVAGDLFHSVRPSNPTLLHATREFARLATALPNTTIVVVAGNHDAPREAQVGCILPLFEMLGVHVVDREAKRLPFPDRDLSVLCVPDIPGIARPALVPDPAFKFNVLVLHGEVKGALPAGAGANLGEMPALEISHEEINTPDATPWDYVALGHYHVYRELAPNMFYAGSMDYTSTNIWGELHEERAAGRSGKGFAERNLVTGEQTFHTIASSRLFVDLPPIMGGGLSPAQIDEALAATFGSFPLDDNVARLVVHDVSRLLARELNAKLLRSYRKRALHLNLDFRQPESRVPAFMTESGQPSVLVPDYHEQALMEADMRETYGDENAPADYECASSLEGALELVATHFDASDPYGLDRYPPKFYPFEER